MTSFEALVEVRTVANLHEHQRRELAVDLAIDGDPALRIHGDRAAFGQVVSRLLDRSLRVSAGATEPRVSLSVRAQGGEAVLEVVDSGPVMTRYQRARLFRPVADADEGVGLYVTRTVVEQTFGGRLVVSSGRPGNVFTVWLPVRRDRLQSCGTTNTLR